MTYTPGERAPVSGVYSVLHDRCHSQYHEITMVAGYVFPPCSGCGRSVRYQLKRQTTHLTR